MKAITFDRFGGPEVLYLADLPIPSPAENEIMVNVKAAAINFGDLSFLKAEPGMVRLMGAGLFKPNHRILGSDMSGIVEKAGSKVTRFKEGDQVFGDLSGKIWGGLGSYLCAPEHLVARKPESISFEEAAASAQAAVVALQGLRNIGKIKETDRVLIYGASGGIGSFAVQIAKSYGCEVTGVCSTRNIELVKSLGADHVIDYTKEDFVDLGQAYDLILATAGYRKIHDYKRALTENGRYVVTGGEMKQIFQGMLLGPFLSKKGGRKLGTLSAKLNADDLAFIAAMLEKGVIRSVIDKRYPLEQAAEAFRYYETKRASGKVVIVHEDDS